MKVRSQRGGYIACLPRAQRQGPQDEAEESASLLTAAREAFGRPEIFLARDMQLLSIERRV